jgi:3D (Asp-Asp-Asp) domain-containing protein
MMIWKRIAALLAALSLACVAPASAHTSYSYTSSPTYSSYSSFSSYSSLSSYPAFTAYSTSMPSNSFVHGRQVDSRCDRPGQQMNDVRGFPVTVNGAYPSFVSGTAAYGIYSAPLSSCESRTGSPTMEEVAAVAAEPVPEVPEIELLTYRVIAGDTLYQISRNFGVSVQIIADLNGINDPSKLHIGQKLQIPVATEGTVGKSVQRVMTSTLTAYTAGVESTGKTPSHPQYGITFSGKRAAEGRTIAVDPKIIPLGSTVYIEGIGVRKAEDTGSAIKGTRIDVFMDDVRLARQFGVKKNVKVYVLEEGEA